MSAPLNMSWTWAWGPAGGLASEAQFGDNPVFDGIRVVVVVAGIFLVMMIGRVLVEQARRHEPMSSGQTFRFLGLGLLVISISVTEAWVFGTTATPRLFLNFTGIVVSIAGVGGKRSRQRREPLASEH